MALAVSLVAMAIGRSSSRTRMFRVPAVATVVPLTATVPVVAPAVWLACCACCTVDKACWSRLVMPVRPLVAALIVCWPWPIWSSKALSELARVGQVLRGEIGARVVGGRVDRLAGRECFLGGGQVGGRSAATTASSAECPRSR